MRSGVATSAAAPVRLKAIALPAEHGGWGLLGEPLALGLLLAPSWPGAGVAVLALFAFLARQPLKLALADRLHGRRWPRTVVAERLVVAYGAGALAGLALAVGGAAGWWWPLLAAAPLASLQLFEDARHGGRRLLPELMGAIALGSVATAVLRAGGWTWPAALAVWALMGAKSVGAILYVRARLRRERGMPGTRAPALASHVAALVAALALAAAGLAPWLSAAALGVLLVRAVHGLFRVGPPVRPQVVGITELAYGVGFVAATAAGVALAW